MQGQQGPTNEELQSEFELLRQRFEDARARTKRRTVTVEFGNGMGNLTVDSNGTLTKVEIQPESLRNADPERLGKQVCEALNQAQKELIAKYEESLDSIAFTGKPVQDAAENIVSKTSDAIRASTLYGQHAARTEEHQALGSRRHGTTY